VLIDLLEDACGEYLPCKMKEVFFVCSYKDSLCDAAKAGRGKEIRRYARLDLREGGNAFWRRP
jgi:hypothetical protein